MEYKIFRITYNDGGWHSGALPHFFYIAHNEEEVEANSKRYADFKERQNYFDGDIWIHEVKGVEFPFEWENLKDFNVSITAVLIGDVVPIKYGEWTHRRWTTECDWGCINHRSVICSACGTEFIDKEPTNYCPECGAKMKEKEKNK